MSERLEMECKRCGDNEDRIDGFCSKECRDQFYLEEDITELTTRIAELEAERIEWVFEDQLPDGIPDAVYSAMYACSEVDFVRVFPSVTVDGRKRFLIEPPEVQA